MRRAPSSMLATGVAVAVLVGGCGTDGATHSTPGPTPPTAIQFDFSSDDFDLAGDLHLPGGGGPHPAVILVHSGGAQDRNSTPSSSLVRDAFVGAGYAVLTYDKPGSGASTGEFDEGHRITQLASILTDAMNLLRARPDIDSDHVGLWGLSEAGWVMPKALEMTGSVSFIVVVGGGGEDSIEQMVYQWSQRAACGGATEQHVALMEELGPLALKTSSYDEYRAAMESLLEIPGLSRYVGVDLEIQPEEEWTPWPRDIDAFFDPMTVIARTTTPVLAIFGEHDAQVDPVQGADAYRAALDRAGNAGSRVETIAGVDHLLRATPSPCRPGTGGYADRYLELLEEWIAQMRTV